MRGGVGDWLAVMWTCVRVWKGEEGVQGEVRIQTSTTPDTAAGLAALVAHGRLGRLAVVYILLAKRTPDCPPIRPSH